MTLLVAGLITVAGSSTAGQNPLVLILGENGAAVGAGGLLLHAELSSAVSSARPAALRYRCAARITPSPRVRRIAADR